MKPEQVYTQGSGENLVILLTMREEGEMAGSVFRMVTAELPECNLTMAVYKAADWDGDFSPWPFVRADGRAFAGNGKKTLEEIQNVISEKYAHTFIAGYSLAGLFSLWSVHETEFFDGCVCCSGSLWFGGWEEYSVKQPLKKPGIVYLSLGGKEERAKDPEIAAIGEKTRREDKRLARDPHVKAHTLVMNPGGHFSSPDKRLAQGICWIMKNLLF